MAATIHLCTNDVTKRLSLVGIANAGHSDYFTATLVVLSRGFSCKHPFFFDRFQAERFIAALESMLSGVITEGVLNQEYEIDHLTVRNDQLGHVFVAGEVNEHGTSHRLMFAIDTDQTVLQPFIDDLNEAIAH
jgi:hypothetical protein